MEIILKRKNVIKKVSRRDKAYALMSKGYEIIEERGDEPEMDTEESQAEDGQESGGTDKPAAGKAKNARAKNTD